MVVVTRWRSLLGGPLLALALLTSLACSPADTNLPLRAAESVETSGSTAVSEAPAPLVESSSFGPSDASGLGSFPAFLPPVAVGTDTQECKLGTDPYSTCI